MKRFQFPLQKVLEYDKHLQDIEAEALSALMAEYRRMELKRDALKTDYLKAIARYEADCRNGQTVSRAAVTGLFIADQRLQIRRLTVKMNEQMSRIEKQREKLVAITQDKTMLEKLKERSYSNYLVAERKGEELLIAELVSNRAAYPGD